MISAIESILKDYKLTTAQEYNLALKQITQTLTLLALSKAKFFDNAAFYGGTALRLLYGLNRFSEDLDFSLISPEQNFDLHPYLEKTKQELSVYGFNVAIEEKQKVNKNPIKSAFIKGNTQINLLKIEAPTNIIQRFTTSSKYTVKLEIDTEPPPLASYDMEFILSPTPFSIKAFDKPSLFAGKLHAVLCRSWKSRVKGRDFYDYIWYLSKDIPCNLQHLEARMKQSKHLADNQQLTLTKLQNLLYDRFASIDWQQAKTDVLPFINSIDELSLWSADFFKAISKKLTVQ